MNANTEDNLADKELVAKVLAGDRAAFAIVIKKTERLVAQIVFRMIPLAEDRKDIAQDVYLKTFKKLPGFKFQARLSTWIAQITYNTCLDHLRKKKLLLAETFSTNTEGEETDTIWDIRGQTGIGDSSEPLFKKELAGILQSAVEKLPPIYKTLISLYHNEEMSYEEIIQITGLPEGTVKNYLFRARKALKESLSTQYKNEEL